MTYAVIRVRGTVNVNPDIKKTLQLMNLTRVNHCVLLEENPSQKGMLQIVKDYVTWGEIDKDVLKKLINLRGRLIGDKKLTDEYIKSSTSFNGIDELAEAIIANKYKYKNIPNIKPIFRLNPPKKGYKTIKRSFVRKGSLGYRGKHINALIEKMI
ncbi:MAG: 50S ribosomal protein L30 [Candidatus Thermoplasmatota archaeon]|jgi:large subunit ribosomal protein L30|nr:50S ribosomal protein L30 [Candidatus Thermoplasmatota archaeon]